MTASSTPAAGKPVAVAATSTVGTVLLLVACCSLGLPADAATIRPQHHRALGDNVTDESHDYACDVELHGIEMPMLQEEEFKIFDEQFIDCAKDFAKDMYGEKPKFEYLEVLAQDWTESSHHRDLAAAAAAAATLGIGGGTKGDGGSVSAVRRLHPHTGKNDVQIRGGCRPARLCDDVLVLDRRRRGLETSGAGGMSDFEQCLHDKLLDKGEGHAAFDSLDEVRVSCSIDVYAPPTHDVLDDSNRNNGTAEETVKCFTTLRDVSAPMLSEAEIAHFDHCYIDTHNIIHSRWPDGTTMLENEVLEQDISLDLLGSHSHSHRAVRDLMASSLLNGQGGSGGAGSQAQQQLRRVSRRDAKRRLGGRHSFNKVTTLKRTCRKCQNKDYIIGDRRRRSMAEEERGEAAPQQDSRNRELDLTDKDMFNFNAALCTCLSKGLDRNNETYAAFSSPGLRCKTKCDQPIPTIVEYEAEQAAALEAFNAAQAEEKRAFLQEWDREDQILGEELKRVDAMIRKHDQERDRMMLALREKQLEFAAYQAYMSKKHLLALQSQCIRVVDTVNCDDIHDLLPPMTDVVRIKEADKFSLKFHVMQAFGIDSSTGQCAALQDEKLPFFVRWGAKYKEGHFEFDCKEEEEECGRLKGEYKAEDCTWDQTEEMFATPVHISFDKRPLPTLGRKLLSPSDEFDVVAQKSSAEDKFKVLGQDSPPARKLGDVEKCEQAEREAQNDMHYCHISLMIDCDCKAPTTV